MSVGVELMIVVGVETDLIGEDGANSVGHDVRGLSDRLLVVVVCKNLELRWWLLTLINSNIWLPIFLALKLLWIERASLAIGLLATTFTILSLVLDNV